MSYLKLGGQIVAVALVAGLLALLAWRLATGSGGAASELGHGRSVVAPGFRLPRLDRSGELSVASLRGKAVVLNFWASWCDPCREEAGVLERTWRRYRGRGLVVLGVDVQDGRTAARDFARKYGMTYPLVHDPRRGGGTVEDYGVAAVPETFFIAPNGRLVGERLQGGVHLEGNRERFERYVRLALAS